MANVHFQLFKILPNKEFIDKIAQLYGIKDFDTNYIFTIKDLEKRNIVGQLNNLKLEIAVYYLNCKFKKYMEDLTEKKSITVLRQFLRVINYKVESKEKYSNRKKYLVYNLKNTNISSDDYDFTINFD
jgi:hypothetical protein